MPMRDVIRRGTPARPHDLWPRLHARLEADEDLVQLRVPSPGWGGVVALTVALATLMMVPDPLVFLAISGML